MSLVRSNFFADNRARLGASVLQFPDTDTQITVSQILSYYCFSNPTAPRTLLFPSAADIIGSYVLGVVQVSDIFPMFMCNRGTSTITYIVPAGNLTDGNMISHPGQNKNILLRVDTISPPSYTLLNIGSALADGGLFGDVVGPASSTDNALVRWNDTTGTVVQNSSVILSDTDTLSGLAGLESSGLTYPTVDGSSNDVMTTDGAGTLLLVSLGTIGGVGGFVDNYQHRAINVPVTGSFPVTTADTMVDILMPAGTGIPTVITTVTLPTIASLAGNKKIFSFKDARGNAQSNRRQIFITPTGGDTIQGLVSLRIRGDYVAFSIYSDTVSNWHVF